MNIYKIVLLAIFTLLMASCDSFTSANNQDINNSSIVEDSNTTIVEDSNTTIVEDPHRRIIVDVNTTNIATIYEDAENQKTNNWTILSNYSHEANITNTYDDERNSRVIYFDAKVTNNNPYSYDTFKFNGINSKKNNQFIQWSMKFNQQFQIGININTKDGGRWLYYIAKDTGAGIDSNYPDSIVQGIGSDKTNNKWHTITRDLQRDLKRYEPDNEFIQINYMTIRGGGYIDNIISYASEDNLDVTKPVIISQPGVVLTFDDTLVKSWNKMRETFKEKGAVATFFCNRWADYSQNWDVKPEEEAILKSFQDDGHEIGFHTVGHLSTRDKKYDNEPNKAQAYFDEQIAPGIANMRERGFEPTSFSYPYMSSQPAHDALIRQELPHIRAFFAHVTLIDNPAHISLETIRKHLEKIKKDKDIEVFLSHWISEDQDADSTIKYKIPKEKLIKIMDMVNELGLKFYTLEEAHNIYMNQ